MLNMQQKEKNDKIFYLFANLANARIYRKPSSNLNRTLLKGIIKGGIIE